MDAEAMKKILPIVEKYGQKLYPPDYLDNKADHQDRTADHPDNKF
jgi:hypothetical protein